MSSNPQRFWKIRDKKTGEFVGKTPAWYRLKEGQYATTSSYGKTYSKLNHAMVMLGLLAEKIDSSQRFETWRNKAEQNRKRQWVFDTVRPYYELVEYRVEEDHVIDYTS